MLETNRLILRHWVESDAESLYEYAKDPEIGPIAGWSPHKDINESLSVIKNVFTGAECYAICEKGSDRAIGAVELKLNGHTDDGNNKSKRVQEKVGFVYHHTCNEVPVPLMNEIRVGHTNFMTKESWESKYGV